MVRRFFQRTVPSEVATINWSTGRYCVWFPEKATTCAQSAPREETRENCSRSSFQPAVADNSGGGGGGGGPAGPF